MPTLASLFTSTLALAACLLPGTLAANSTTEEVVSVAATATTLSAKGTILILATDTTAAQEATIGLNAYGIPYSVLTIPSAGATLPDLEDNSTGVGNYGGVVVLDSISYDYGGTTGWQSALTTTQWSSLYDYQLKYGVRMVQINVYPGSDFGTTALGGCCDSGVEQYMYITDTSAFPTAGLKVWANVSTSGLYHYPASISDTTTTTEFLQFGSNSLFTSNSTAGVINNFGGREQMAFFVSFGMTWSPSSNYIAHTWIHWITRGLYAGFRRVYLGTQIDDVFLETDLYSPAGSSFRVRASDLEIIKSWTSTINAKMNAGSSYWVELGYNGNGNIETATASSSNGDTICSPGSIEYDDMYSNTSLEFQKPLGTGTDVWPETPTVYGYSTSCLTLDALETWIATTSNRDVFGHISHTFTHLELNNATYSDAAKEIQFNQAWLSQTGISGATHFSSKSLIPPAITGLHNGDVLRAWADNGLTSCVGDNTRSPLVNQNNGHWPLISTVADNGYAGFQITPRWSSAIYYNCDLPDCTYAEWVATSAGSGGFENLMATEKSSNIARLLSLYHAPYMFHQANLRASDVATYTINGVTAQLSLMQIWVETIVQELVRLVNWPIITLGLDDLSVDFMNRMTRDACSPSITYLYSASGNATAITGFTVSTTSNTCGASIPVTVPGTVTDTQGFVTEQKGSDPLTIWVSMSGSPVTFTLTTPISV